MKLQFNQVHTNLYLSNNTNFKKLSKPIPRTLIVTHTAINLQRRSTKPQIKHKNPKINTKRHNSKAKQTP